MRRRAQADDLRAEDDRAVVAVVGQVIDAGLDRHGSPVVRATRPQVFTEFAGRTTVLCSAAATLQRSVRCVERSEQRLGLLAGVAAEADVLGDGGAVAGARVAVAAAAGGADADAVAGGERDVLGLGEVLGDRGSRRRG